MAKDLGFKSKMKLRADKPSVKVKHIVKDTTKTKTTLKTVRIPNSTLFELNKLKSYMTEKTNKVFLFNVIFTKVLENIMKDFDNKIIHKRYEKYISASGERFPDNENTTRKSIVVSFILNAKLKEQITFVNKEFNTKLSFNTIFSEYLLKEIKKYKSNEGIL